MVYCSREEWAVEEYTKLLAEARAVLSHDEYVKLVTKLVILLNYEALLALG